MLNYIWSALVILSILCAVVLGNAQDLSKAIVESAAAAVELLLTMVGLMGLWSGIMRIARDSGLTDLLARLFAPLLKPLFPRLRRDSEAFRCITMNVTANLLGLGNTATPFGLQAMRELNRLSPHGTTASDEMVTFVVMNTASLQLMPTMLGSLRQRYGSAAPFEILVPVWISSAAALAVALVIVKCGNRVGQLKA